MNIRGTITLNFQWGGGKGSRRKELSVDIQDLNNLNLSKPLLCWVMIWVADKKHLHWRSVPAAFLWLDRKMPPPSPHPLPLSQCICSVESEQEQAWHHTARRPVDLLMVLHAVFSHQDPDRHGLTNPQSGSEPLSVFLSLIIVILANYFPYILFNIVIISKSTLTLSSLFV